MKTLPPLLLVRHAQAEHHIQKITGGWSDTELTPTGIQQSNLLAKRLKHEIHQVSIHLGTGTLKRAKHTANIIGHQLHVSATVYDSLTDLNNGIAAGKTHSEAKEIAIPPREPLLDWQPYPEAESWRQFYARVTDFIEGFTACQETPVLFVSHSATIHVIIAWWLRLPVDSQTHFDVAPASITVLKTNKWGERSIERLNDTSHLYTAGMTNPIHLT